MQLRLGVGPVQCLQAITGAAAGIQHPGAGGQWRMAGQLLQRIAGGGKQGRVAPGVDGIDQQQQPQGQQPGPGNAKDARHFGANAQQRSAFAVVQSESSTMLEAPAGGGAMTMGASCWFTGLTPGTAYYAELIAATGTAGQTVTVAFPRIQVVPER